MLDPKGFNELKSCRLGPMLFNKNDWPIGLSLLAYGEFSWSEALVFEQIVGQGQTVVDAGANIGAHTLRLSQLVGNGVVYAFEPQRIAFQTLCANAALNNCTNVYAYQKALGDRDDEIVVPVRNQYERNNFGGVPLAGVTEGESVPICRLDGLQLKECHFIKADLEGMEAEFLRGAAETVCRCRPILYIEADGAQGKEAMRMLFEWGYELYWNLAPLFNPDNFAGNKQHLFLYGEGSEVVSVNALCIPGERESKIIGLEKVKSVDDDPFKVEFERRKKLTEGMRG